MKEKLYEEIARLSLKRELSPEDRLRIETSLAAHPEAREEWESDAALGKALGALRDAPVSSNFTSRVLEALEFEERSVERERQEPRAGWLHWLQPRLTSAIALAFLALFGAYEYRAHQRSNTVRAIATDVGNELASIPPSLPATEIFTDFDAIDSLRQVSAASDDELLTVLAQ